MFKKIILLSVTTLMALHLNLASAAQESKDESEEIPECVITE